jgi:hypothetical protein
MVDDHQVDVRRQPVDDCSMEGPWGPGLFRSKSCRLGQREFQQCSRCDRNGFGFSHSTCRSSDSGTLAGVSGDGSDGGTRCGSFGGLRN